MKYVYFELNYFIFFKVLFSNKLNYFFLKNSDENLKKSILKKKKNCNFVNFETSKINYKKQNIHFIADKLTNQYTKEIITELSKSQIVEDCNRRFYNNDLRLAISRYIYLELNPLILKLQTVNQFLKGRKLIHYHLHDRKLKKYIEKKNYGIFLETKKNSYREISFRLTYTIYILLNKLLGNFNIKKKKLEKKILLNVENQINFKKYLRSDFFFLKNNIGKIVITKDNKNLNISTLKKNNVEIINSLRLIFSKQDKNINIRIDNIFDKLLKNTKLKFEFNGLLNYLNNIKFTMKKISPIFINNRIKYSISTSSDKITLSIEMLRQLFKFKTISYQYSFIKNSNPIMSNCSNVMYIFSNYFLSFFKNFYSKPKEIRVSGYLYSSLIKLCKSKEKYLKRKLAIKKNMFVVSYFDENCKNSSWSLSTIKDMEKKYISFAKFVLENKNITFLVKTQFINNNPSILFPKNKIIISALKTKRFIELDQSYFLKNYRDKILSDNYIRNTVLPMMVAQISDMTISEKYGGTTSLESIILNKRNIMINDKNFKSDFDAILGRNIQFKDLDSMLKRIIIFINNISQNKKDELGDWKKIINKKKIVNYEFKNDKFLKEIGKYLKL